MIRIGITQRVEVVESYGERRDSLDQEWSRLLSDLGLLPVPLPNAPSRAALLLDELDLAGFLLSGGNDLAHLEDARSAAPERDQFERELLTLATDRGLPVLGVCRGMQMMVCHYGGSLVPVTGHVREPHGLLVRDGELSGFPLTAREVVNTFHDYGVPADGSGRELRPLAFAPDGTVEAVVHESLPQWGIMWHPERAPNDRRDGDIVRHVFQSR